MRKVAGRKQRQARLRKILIRLKKNYQIRSFHSEERQQILSTTHVGMALKPWHTDGMEYDW